MNFRALFVRRKGNKGVIIEFWARTKRQANQSMQLYAKELNARLISLREKCPIELAGKRVNEMLTHVDSLKLHSDCYDPAAFNRWLRDNKIGELVEYGDVPDNPDWENDAATVAMGIKNQRTGRCVSHLNWDHLPSWQVLMNSPQVTLTANMLSGCGGTRGTFS